MRISCETKRNRFAEFMGLSNDFRGFLLSDENVFNRIEKKLNPSISTQKKFDSKFGP